MYDPALDARKLTKRFGATTVLDTVDLTIFPGEVHGVVGENGAGKTTLLNIISGIVGADAGSMRLHGHDFRPRDYAQAATAGVSRVFQEQALIPNIRVYENLLLSHEERFTSGGQWLRTGEMISAAREIMREAGIDVDVRQTTADLSFSKRQLVEIVRACLVPHRLLEIDCPIVLLDEPTASLEKADEEAFFRLISAIRRESAILFISHRLGEVLTLTDRITVLKDGAVVAVLDRGEADERRLHALMVGRERAADYYREARQIAAEGGPVLFSLHALAGAGTYLDIDLDIRAGEIVGIGGLVASGKSPLGKGAAGVVPPAQGDIVIAGESQTRPEISALIRKGLGYVPAERLAEGMIASFPVSWNISLASGADLFSSHAGVWNVSQEDKAALAAIERLAIKARGPRTICSTLSGGNQQKVVLARWLCRDLKVLVLDNPTRGVDAGAKEEIYEIIRGLSERGVAILLISDELLELIGLSNRIAIMRHGRITTILEAPPDRKPGEQEVIEHMLTDRPQGRVHATAGLAS
jgi:ribose transport system ATP-binding protein